jgi:hypothetical protein
MMATIYLTCLYLIDDGDDGDGCETDSDYSSVEECCGRKCVSTQCNFMNCEIFDSTVCACVGCEEGKYCYTGDVESLTGSVRCCPNLEPIDEENCLRETCYYDDSGMSALHGCPYRCSKCKAEETCSNGHCCAKGEVYIEEAGTYCPSARDCGHFCCSKGEYCASIVIKSCILSYVI